MKRVIPFLLMAIAFVACQNEPDLNALSSDLLVYTNYDKDCDFGKYQTFAIPDSILVLSDDKKPIYISSNDPRTSVITDAIVNEMELRGYRLVEDNKLADLGLQTSFVKSTNTIVSYAATNPYWWYGYGYYWPYSYWNPYYAGWAPYYAYPVTYTYTVGSFIIEMVALKDANPTTKKIPVVWTAYMVGVMSGNQLNLSHALSGIYQAFEQSTYIHTSK